MGMTEFRPVIAAGDGLVVDDGPTEPGFHEGVRQVLAYYGVRHEVDGDGRVRVPARVWSDRDLMWNYTTKARDPDWLATHS